MMPDSLDPRRKKLIYVSNHRGMKETDAILGGFASTHIDELTEDQVDRFEALMWESDNDLLNWLTDKEEVPEAHNHDLFAMIRAFKDAL